MPVCALGDINGDGVDELLVIELTSDGKFSWLAMGENQTNFATPLSSLGVIGDIAIPGSWNEVDYTSIGVVHQEKSGSLTWTIQSKDGTKMSMSFGSQPATIITAADIDGSGLADAIVLTTTNATSTRNSKLQWFVRTDPFGPSHLSQEFTFSLGTRDDTIFFLNPDGARDRLGLVSSNKPEGETYDVLTNTSSPLPIPKIALKTNKIYPIRSSSGVDNLIVIRKLEYWIIDSTGQEIVQGKLRTQGNAVIGNYVSTLSGDEIAIRSGRGGAVPILNPELRTATTFFPKDGVLLDTIQIGRFGPYRLPPASQYTYQCSRIEDRATIRGREFKTTFTGKGELAIQTRRLFSKVEIETESGTVYPLTFWKSDGKKGGIWRGYGFTLSKILPLGKVVGTINDERTCWSNPSEWGF